MCDIPRYVKLVNGVWVECKKEVAEAISVGGHPFEGAVAKEHDGGEVAFNDHVRLDEQSNLITVNGDATADIGDTLSTIMDAIEELTEIIAEMQEG